MFIDRFDVLFTGASEWVDQVVVENIPDGCDPIL
jgi:hypothetical protein